MKLNIRKLEIMIVIAFTGLMISAVAFADLTRSEASVGGPPTGHTGAPGESTCTSCHNSNAGPGQLSILAPANYVPGQTYTIQVQHATTDPSRAVWGFELTSLTSANVNAGIFANTTANTRIRTATSGKNYIEQTITGSYPSQTAGAVWTFSWTAPSTNVGTVTLYAAGIEGDNSGDESGDQTYIRTAAIQTTQAVVIHHGFTDFDGDGKADASVFRASDQNWYISRSTAGLSVIQWGIGTDNLTPADFDGDDKADIAVWRAGAPTVAAFYILQSSTNTVRIEPFGQTGDDPMIVGDWDGDGKADPSIYRNSAVGSQSYFYYGGSLNNPSGNVTYVPFGTTGDIAMRGDFDGDGKIDAAVFRPSTAVWYIAQSSTGTVRYDNWGLPTDKFVPADYDGDGKTDLAVFRGGVWYVRQSSNGSAAYYSWGLDTDLLVPADFDGDGKTDPAVYRGGAWYIRQSGSGTLSVQNFGNTTDKPVANAFVK